LEQENRVIPYSTALLDRKNRGNKGMVVSEEDIIPSSTHQTLLYSAKVCKGERQLSGVTRGSRGGRPPGRRWKRGRKWAYRYISIYFGGQM